MKTLHRKSVNYDRSRSTFNHLNARTKLINLIGSFRGGIRL